MKKQKIKISSIFILLIFSSVILISFKKANSRFHKMDIPPYSGGAAKRGLGDRTGSPLSIGQCSNCHDYALKNLMLTNFEF